MKLEERNDSMDYCSTQVNLKNPSPIISYITDNIAPEDLHEFGIETEPHVTILYGITSDKQIPYIKRLCKEVSSISIKLGNVSLFKSNYFDVLKVDIISPDLHKLYSIFAQELDFKSEFPSYIPHLTYAYLKKGRGEKYLNLNKFSGLQETMDFILFKFKSGNGIKIPVGNDIMKENYTQKLYDLTKTSLLEGRNPFNIKDFAMKFKLAKNGFLTSPDLIRGKNMGTNQVDIGLDNLVKAIQIKDGDALIESINILDRIAETLLPENKVKWDAFRAYVIAKFLPKNDINFKDQGPVKGFEH